MSLPDVCYGCYFHASTHFVFKKEVYLVYRQKGKFQIKERDERGSRFRTCQCQSVIEAVGGIS